MRRGDRFFGREDELTTLVGALRDVEAGRGRLVLLAGEAGIGKTRIAAEIARSAAEEGAVVLWGRCHDAEGAPAYWPWMQVARAWREHAGGEQDELAKLERRLAAPAARQDAAPEQSRFVLFERVSSALRAASRRGTLLLVLDDLHWADRASVKLLQFVGREVTSARILILGTFREVDPTMPADVATLLGDTANLGTTLPIRGLDRAQVAELIADRAGNLADERLVTRIHDATQGNPLFVGEVVDLLVAERRSAGTAGARSGALPIPLGVRAAIARRIETLDATARGVLAAAAVCGREFSTVVLERALALPAPALLEALTQAERLGVVTRVRDAGGRIVFSHALVRETLYEELGAPERTELHRAIGGARVAARGRSSVAPRRARASLPRRRRRRERRARGRLRLPCRAAGAAPARVRGSGGRARARARGARPRPRRHAAAATRDPGRARRSAARQRARRRDDGDLPERARARAHRRSRRLR